MYFALPLPAAPFAFWLPHPALTRIATHGRLEKMIASRAALAADRERVEKQAQSSRMVAHALKAAEVTRRNRLVRRRRRRSSAALRTL